jgi:predicted Zn-dependent protease with MMP-like domain
MKREDFVKVAEETWDSLPEEFRSRIQNVAILVEDFPPKRVHEFQPSLRVDIHNGSHSE